MSNKKITTRRNFLRATGLTAAGFFGGGCGRNEPKGENSEKRGSVSQVDAYAAGSVITGPNGTPTITITVAPKLPSEVEPLDLGIPFDNQVESTIATWEPADITSIVVETVKRVDTKSEINFRPSSYADMRGVNATLSSDGSYFTAENVRTKMNENFSIENILRKTNPAGAHSSIDSACLFDSKNERIYLLPNYGEVLQEKGFGDQIDGKVFRVANDGTVVYGLYPSGKKDEFIAAVFARFGAKKTHTYFKGDINWSFPKFWISADGKIGRIMTEKNVVFYNINTLEFKENGFGEVEAMSADGNVVILRYDHPRDKDGATSTYVLFDEKNIIFDSIGGPEGRKVEFSPIMGSARQDATNYVLSPKGTAYMTLSPGRRGELDVTAFGKVGNDFTELRPDSPITFPAELRDLLNIDDFGNVYIGVKYSFKPVLPAQPLTRIPQ